ncbi:MAG: SUMF1/EgtB/PvdO family nonheme iron enzyme [Magnetococcales bacterium]|nr:SUMF1/EgtB/PvdO family nonheme iron enzyme [Magnetococcales bacterium]
MGSELTHEQAQGILSQRIPSYRIEKKLGAGTYGEVFLAYDKDTEKRYAVKIFHLEAQRAVSAEDGSLASASSRLNRDWRLLMDHHERFKTCPALVDIPIFFKVDRQENLRGQALAWGIAVMEYFPSNLHDYVLDYMEEHGKPLPSEIRLALIQKLAQVLEILHGITDIDGHPFVYEDLKPENVLVSGTSSNDSLKVVIGDIGGLKRIGGSSLSSGGQITLSYAAPEVFPPARQRVDQISMIYSFGLIGYFVIEGRRPHDDMSLTERFDRIESDPGFTSRMTDGLENAVDVIRKCLRINREERYANFEDAFQALSQKEKRVGSGPTILPALHHEEPIPILVHSDPKPLTKDENIVIGSGETIVPVKSPNEENNKEVQEKKSNAGQEEEAKNRQNIISQPFPPHAPTNKRKLIATSVFGLFFIIGAIILVKYKDNQRMEDSSSHEMQTVPPSPNSSTAGEFVKVPGGTFQMGCGSWQSNCSEDEKPVHDVKVGTFEIGKYEVTQGQWKDVMGSYPSNFSSCGSNCPVENVSWGNARDFIGKLNSRSDGCTYRLPTEAEWEYACRSGGKNEKYCGGGNLDQLAWYDNNSGGKTHPVGQKTANGLGIYDMSGNVWEWVSDWYDEKFYANSPRDNPQGPSLGSGGVRRGGSWDGNAAGVRSAYRLGDVPGGRNRAVGFRLSRICP